MEAKGRWIGTEVEDEGEKIQFAVFCAYSHGYKCSARAVMAIVYWEEEGILLVELLY